MLCLVASASPATGLTNGVADDGDPAVVAVVVDSHEWCSGVVVAPRVVLTAATCVFVPGELQVYLGPGLAAGGGQLVDVLHAEPHPDFNATTRANDLAVLLLDEPLTVTPRQLGPPPALTDELRLVGYGHQIPEGTDAHFKRSGTSAVTKVFGAGFEVSSEPSQPCYGDEGGPALAGDTLVGIVTRFDTDCAKYGRYTRLDVYADTFIRPFIAAAEPGAAEVGDGCYYDEQCASGHCYAPADAPSFGYCTDSCENCPLPLECTDELCSYPQPSPGAAGANCLRNWQCETGLCLEAAEPGSTGAVCAIPCDAEQPSCPQGFHCAAAEPPATTTVCTPTPEPDGCQTTSTLPNASGLMALMLAIASLGRRKRR